MSCNRVAVFVFSILSLPLIFLSPAQAQVTDAKPQLTKQQNEDGQKKEWEKKALALLDQLVAESASFPSAENRITVLSEACQLFWSRDQARSRKLIDELKEQIIAYTDQPYPGARQNLRTQFLDWLGSKDAEMALNFLRSTREKAPVQDDRQLEVRLAATVAANNPQLAFQMAQELLKTDVQGQVVDIWRNLRGKDPKLGKKLAVEMIADIKSKDLLNSQNFYLAITLLYQLKETAYTPDVSPNDGKGSTVSQDRIGGERQEYLDLLDLIAGAALKFMSEKSTDATESNGVSGQEFLTHVNNLMPEIESQLPTRATALRGKVAQYEKIFPRAAAGGQISEYEQQIQKMEGKSGKDLLDVASSAPPQLKEAIFMNAITKASEQGDLETARSIVNLHEAAYPQLKQFLSQIEGQFAIKIATEGRYDEAKRALSKLGTDDERVSVLLQFASGALSRNDEKTARGFLDEASAILGDKMRTNKQLVGQIAVAGGYRGIDPNRSFEIMEAVIDRLNQVSTAAKEYFAFSQNDEAEILMMTGPVVDMFSPVPSELAQLAHKDFDRTIAILKKTQIAELRVRLGVTLIFYLLGDDGELQH